MSSRTSSSRKRPRTAAPVPDPVESNSPSESELEDISDAGSDSGNDLATSSKKKGKAPVRGKGKGKAPAKSGKVTAGRKRKRGAEEAVPTDSNPLALPKEPERWVTLYKDDECNRWQRSVGVPPFRMGDHDRVVDSNGTFQMYWSSALPRLINETSPCGMYRSVFDPETSGSANINLEFHVNISTLDHRVSNGLPILFHSFFFKSVEKALSTKPSSKSSTTSDRMASYLEPFNQTSRPYNDSADVDPRKQPDGMQVQLYTYQLKSLGWMVKLEERIARGEGFEFCDLVQFEGSKVWLDLRNEKFYLKQSSRKLVMRSRGGILADHMGLGKTLTVVGLIMANPSPLKQQGSAWLRKWRGDDEDDYLLQSTATVILVPPHLVKQWETEVLKVWPDCEVLSIATKTQWDKITYKAIMMADIVLISFSWLKNKCFTDHHEEPMDEYTPSEIKNTKKNRLPADYRINVIRRRGVEFKRKKDALDETSPILELFMFHRVVIDEGHEVLAEKHSSQQRNAFGDLLEGIQSQFRWYVSGSPFPAAWLSMVGALKFLQWGVYKVGRKKLSSSREGDEDGADSSTPPEDANAPKSETNKNEEDEDSSSSALGSSSHHNNQSREFGPSDFRAVQWSMSPRMDPLSATLLSMIREGLFCRRDREDVKGEAMIPPIVEEVIMFDFSDVERGMYHSAMTGSLRQRQLCCHMQISDTDRAVFGPEKRTLEEIKDMMITHTAQNISAQRNRMKDLHNRIQDAQARECKNLRATQRRDQDVKDWQADVQRVVAEIAKLQSMKVYFESIVSAVTQSTMENCAICMDEIRAMVITTCGHIFCSDCLQTWLGTQARCPSCRHVLKQKDLSEVITHDSLAAKNINATHSFKELQNKYGTKMARLIEYIRQHLDGRFIIFSQWDPMLHKVGETLKENDVPNVFVQGNVHVRNAALKKFQNDEKIRVVMLSLENAASGTNLTEATHVILLDPVAGTAEQARAIEGQAIGRAHRLGQQKQITVVRFIVRGTIEEELYRRNTSVMDVARVQGGSA